MSGEARADDLRAAGSILAERLGMIVGGVIETGRCALAVAPGTQVLFPAGSSGWTDDKSAPAACAHQSASIDLV